jgi:hypothetical protein
VNTPFDTTVPTVKSPLIELIDTEPLPGRVTIVRGLDIARAVDFHRATDGLDGTQHDVADGIELHAARAGDLGRNRADVEIGGDAVAGCRWPERLGGDLAAAVRNLAAGAATVSGPAVKISASLSSRLPPMLPAG